MAFCAQCGAELPAAARFCPACGRPVDVNVGAPGAPAGAPTWSGLRLPGWAAADWGLVALGAGLLLALLFAVSAAFGMVAAVAAAGEVAAAPCGAAVGSHLAFAAFGARTAAACSGEHGAALLVTFLPLPWALVGAWATEGALSFAWARLPDERVRRVAYAAKLALASGVGLGVIAGFVGTGDAAPRGSGFASELNGGEVAVYTAVLTGLWAWVGLRRRGLRLVPAGAPDRTGMWARTVGQGALVFVALAGGLGVAGLVAGLVVADGRYERVGLLFGFPVVGFSFGAALLDGAMGAGLGGVDGHTSLTHFGLPAGPRAEPAPWLFPAVLLVPGAVAVTVWRCLERERPSDEQGALAVGGAIGAGFAVAAWLAALVGRIGLVAAAARPAARSFVALRPNPAAVLGLGLVWALGAGLAAGFGWATARHAVWRIDGGRWNRPGGRAGGPDGAVPPDGKPGQEPAEGPGDEPPEKP